jgi:nickel/cobalt transporter (NiCoT) family protein
MAAVIAVLHLAGWGVFVALVAPRRLTTVGIGLAITAYTLGMRHAFDADHISAIDNTTRKLMAEGKRRPLGTGFFFSVGHSVTVFGLGVAVTFAARAVFGAIRDPHSALASLGGLVGTSISGLFLYLIAALNAVVLAGVVKVFIELRRGRFTEAELEAHLGNRGLMSRFLGPMMRSITRSRHMIGVGMLFGLGFDTVTEIALFGAVAGAATQGLPWWGVLVLPTLFAAGMTLLDTADGIFMTVAYGWAFARPVRKVFYNIAITGLSVAVALIIGTIELLGVLATEFRLRGAFWDRMSGFDINTAGFIIAGLFAATWVIALCVWRIGRFEASFAAAPGSGSAAGESAPCE